MAYNAPVDAYDSATHRVLVPDCASDSLLTVDVATGEREVLIDESSRFQHTTCFDDIVVDQDGGRAFAIMHETFPDPETGELPCSASSFVSIETETGSMYSMQDLHFACCDGCKPGEAGYAPQIDALNYRLLYVDAECYSDPDLCLYSLSGAPLNSRGPERVANLYLPPCYPHEEGCEADPIEPLDLTFDPVAPDQRALIVSRTSSKPLQPFIDSIDYTTGQTVETIPIQTTWGNLVLGYLVGVSVDVPNWRVLVILASGDPSSETGDETVWGVVAIDRLTGVQTLLYDGGPAADGASLACTPEAAIDTRNGRLLLIEPSSGDQCQGNMFALDLTTGAFSRL